MRLSRLATLLVGALPALALAQGKPPAAPAKTPTKDAPPPVEAREWEHDRSDLPPDPKFTFGSLKNGMRYVWANNRNPSKEVFLRLHVNIGSLVESETELGMAHFVEHMAFNGTLKFKAGTLVETFNKQGIKFGHDVNAHTAQNETVYELDLPDTEPERLKISLAWMRDVACGLRMDDKEVQSEKGVIDSEQRDRDSEGFRKYVEQLTKLGDGLLFPKRLPIGIKEVRAKFTGKSCLAFYKRWYRPTNQTFMIIGDLGTLDPTKLIEETFGTIPASKDEEAERPDLGTPSFKYKGFGIETGGPGRITIAKLRPGKPPRDDSKSLVAAVPLTIACELVGNRLVERKEKEKLPFLGAGADRFDFEGLITGAEIQVICEPGKWREALTAAERELRRLLERGCTDEEVSKAWADFDATQRPRPSVPPPDSREYLAELMKACNERYVPMEDKARKEARKPGKKGVTGESLVKAFKAEWDQGTLVIYAEGGIKLGADPEAELMEAWKAAKATDLDQPMAGAGPEVAKNDDPKKPADDAHPGPPDDPNHPSAPDATDKPKEEPKKTVEPWHYSKPAVNKDPNATAQRLDDVKVVSIQLKNGVKVNYRKSDGDPRSFGGRWEVRVGDGESALAPAQHAIAWVASQFFLQGGLAKDDWASVQAAGGGVGFGVDADALVFSGAMIFGGDCFREFESICAFLTEPGFRADAWDEWKKKLPDHWKKDEGKEDLRKLLARFDESFRAAEPRLSQPTQAQCEAVTLEDVKKFVSAQLDGPVRITASGVDGGKFEKAVYSTFSLLPDRKAGSAAESARTITPLKSGVNERHEVEQGAASALLFVRYPCPDSIDAAMARKLALLEDIVGDRLRVEIREKRGGAYSPNASITSSEEWRGLGWVELHVQVDPAKADEMAKACVATMEALGAKGATQPELDRMRIAHLGNIDQLMKDQNLWFSALRAAHRNPAGIEEMRNLKATYDKITLAEINALCKQVFVKGKESVFIGIPKK